MGDEGNLLGLVKVAASGDRPLLDPSRRQPRLPVPTRAFEISKRVFDVAASLSALPVVLLVGVVLLLINPIWNRGPLVFAQKRMGKGCKPFVAYKFRTMVPCDGRAGRLRGPFDPVEANRITRLGAFLRRTRIDEFPQFFNVITGDMSVIGPRPDQWDHARHFVVAVPGYRDRHRVRPGITGLAQIAKGYAEGEDATLAKTRADLAYIRKLSWRSELRIILGTIRVMCTGFGAR